MSINGGAVFLQLNKIKFLFNWGGEKPPPRKKRAFTGKVFRCKRSFCLILLTLSQKKAFNRVWKLLQSQQTQFLQRQGIEGLVCICARVTSDDGSTYQVEFTIAFHPSHIVQYF